MATRSGPDIRLFRLLARLDQRLLATSTGTRRLVVILTLAVMIGVSIPNLPRQYIDYSRLPLLNHVRQHETFGTDTIADMYEAKVVLNSPADMYTKAKAPQTPLEARMWSKEASAPYPPAMLLVEAGLAEVGRRTGIGFYGAILALACVFVALSLRYFLETRWYLFPVLYLNFVYFGYRFIYVQDGSYLVMLLVVIAALRLARRHRDVSDVLMAVAITMKLSPLYYAKRAPAMHRWTAVLFVAILVACLVLPYFIWENYLSIFRFNSEVKGRHWYDAAGALALVVPFTIVLWYVETRLESDAEDRIGWGLVPFAMFLAFKMNVARHLLIVLLVPDKRGARNIAAAIGLAVPALLPGLVHFNAALPIATAVLVVALAYDLDLVGMDVIKDDLRHPGRTAKMMLAAG
jgi:hypothetical protein